MSAARDHVTAVRYHVINDYSAEITGESDEEIAEKMRASPELRARRYSVVSVCAHPGRGTIFCGMTNTGHDLLAEFDPKTGTFRSCGYAKIANECEAKIHRGLWLDEREDALYFATSTLSPLPRTYKSDGAPLVRYDVAADRFEILCRPTRGIYYQATNYDPVRRKLYFFGIPGMWFGVYDLEARRVVRHDIVESIPHIGAIDDDGGVWGTWSDRRHAFFRYDPDADEMDFFDGQFALPSAERAANIMYHGAGPIDSMINGGDGFLYVGTALAELYRLDPRKRTLEFLGKPHHENRIQGLVMAPDGSLYGAGGRRDTFLFRYDTGLRAFRIISDLTAPDGKRCTYPHDLAMVGDTIYIGETDNPRRSGYLWEVTL